MKVEAVLMDEEETDILKRYSSVFSDKLNIRVTRGRDFNENSTLNLEYGENGKILGNETKTQKRNVQHPKTVKKDCFTTTVLEPPTIQEMKEGWERGREGRKAERKGGRKSDFLLPNRSFFSELKLRYQMNLQTH